MTEHDRRTNYQRGADFERKVRDHLLYDHEANLVVRSAGSHGPVDLVAFFMGIDAEAPLGDLLATRPIIAPVVWLVQAKKDGKLSEEDRDLLLDIAAETGARAFMAWLDPGNGVQLTELNDDEGGAT